MTCRSLPVARLALDFVVLDSRNKGLFGGPCFFSVLLQPGLAHYRANVMALSNALHDAQPDTVLAGPRLAPSRRCFGCPGLGAGR